MENPQNQFYKRITFEELLLGFFEFSLKGATAILKVMKLKLDENLSENGLIFCK